LTFHPDYYKDNHQRFHRSPYDHAAARRSLTTTDNCVYLEDASHTAGSLEFYGSPWQPWFQDWAFNLARGAPCREVWERIPTATDVLVTHGPPIGRGDMCAHGNRAGCVDLLREVQQRVKPRLHIFGAYSCTLSLGICSLSPCRPHT
jgi:hypothetical protein